MNNQVMSQEKRLFESIDEKLRNELTMFIMDYIYKDPAKKPRVSDLFGPDSGSAKVSEKLSEFYKPEYEDLDGSLSIQYQLWRQYFLYAEMHGLPKNKKGTQFRNFDTVRRKDLKRLAQHLGRNPTVEDFKQFFNLPAKFDLICEVINKDINDLI